MSYIDYWWNNNTTVQQLLGLCPLLAISTSWQSAWPLAAATFVVLISAHLLIASLRHIIPESIRLPIFIFLLAAMVSICQYWMAVWLPWQAQMLGLYLGLITTNCVLLADLERNAYRLAWRQSITAMFHTAASFSMILITLALLRQAIFNLSLQQWLIAHLAVGAFWSLAGIIILHRLTTKFHQPNRVVIFAHEKNN